MKKVVPVAKGKTEHVSATAKPCDEGVLASEMAKSFGNLVQCYMKHWSLSKEEAVERAAVLPSDGGQRALNLPPDQVNWSDLQTIARIDPDRAAAFWEAIKQAALNEVRTGHRSAKAVETANDSAWTRAQFLALREELASEWQPRNGIERQLLDTMAQAQVGYLTWLYTLNMRTNLESHTNEKRQQEEGKWGPPRQSDADAIEQSAEMMDRYNRIFLRTLRALCDMRKQSNTVYVQNGGQMNVAQQQVNVSTSAK